MSDILATARVEKRNYSRNPWRIVAADGREIEAPRAFSHSMLGNTSVLMPMAYPRKRDALEALARAQKPTEQP